MIITYVCSHADGAIKFWDASSGKFIHQIVDKSIISTSREYAASYAAIFF